MTNNLIMNAADIGIGIAIGIVIGVGISCVTVITAGLLYRYRLEIGFVMHLTK